MKGNNLLIVCLLFVLHYHLDDGPPPVSGVGQRTRWKSSHDCDVEEYRGVDEVDARAFMLIWCSISQNDAPLS
jgi:hypothetical protein